MDIEHCMTTNRCDRTQYPHFTQKTNSFFQITNPSIDQCTNPANIQHPTSNAQRPTPKGSRKHLRIAGLPSRTSENEGGFMGSRLSVKTECFVPINLRGVNPESAGPRPAPGARASARFRLRRDTRPGRSPRFVEGVARRVSRQAAPIPSEPTPRSLPYFALAGAVSAVQWMLCARSLRNAGCA